MPGYSPHMIYTCHRKIVFIYNSWTAVIGVEWWGHLHGSGNVWWEAIYLFIPIILGKFTQWNITAIILQHILSLGLNLFSMFGVYCVS